MKNEITPDSEYLIRWAKDTGNFLKNAGIKLTQEQINEIKDSCDEFKGPLVYRIKYDNGKELVIEKRKKINEALNYYLNKKRLDIIYKNY